VWNWSKGIGINQDIRDRVNELNLNLADELESIAFQCAGLLPQKLPDAGVKEIVGAMSQSIEKSRLLRGESTQNNATKIEQTVTHRLEQYIAIRQEKDNVTLTLEQAEQEIRELEA